MSIKNISFAAATVLLANCASVGIPSGNVCSNADGALSKAAFVFVTTPRPGQRVRSGFTVKGCSRTFEASVSWRLLGRDGAEIATGHTTGGGVDGPGEFKFSVPYTLTERQIGRLEVYEEDVSDGEGFPTPINVIPVVLRP